jgi:hypothetical protein
MHEPGAPWRYRLLCRVRHLRQRFPTSFCSRARSRITQRPRIAVVLFWVGAFRGDLYIFPLMKCFGFKSAGRFGIAGDLVPRELAI